jgi:hypothetical protein
VASPLQALERCSSWGSKGDRFNIGLDRRFAGGLLVGPSDIGFADPGQSTAISVFQITSAFVGWKPNTEDLISLAAMHVLCTHVVTLFTDAQLHRKTD